MRKMISQEEFQAATNFINNCHIMFPEHDLLDDQTRKDLINCHKIVYMYKKQFTPTENKKVKQQKPKKKGKIAQFEEDVKECLRQGMCEERYLLEEAYARKNPFARKNYVQAYYRAVADFQRK